MKLIIIKDGDNVLHYCTESFIYLYVSVIVKGLMLMDFGSENIADVVKKVIDGEKDIDYAGTTIQILDKQIVRGQ